MHVDGQKKFSILKAIEHLDIMLSCHCYLRNLENLLWSLIPIKYLQNTKKLKGYQTESSKETISSTVERTKINQYQVSYVKNRNNI